jgi:hypothetical protein
MVNDVGASDVADLEGGTKGAAAIDDCELVVADHYHIVCKWAHIYTVRLDDGQQLAVESTGMDIMVGPI